MKKRYREWTVEDLIDEIMRLEDERHVKGLSRGDAQTLRQMKKYANEISVTCQRGDKICKECE